MVSWTAGCDAWGDAFADFMEGGGGERGPAGLGGFEEQLGGFEEQLGGDDAVIQYVTRNLWK